MEVDKNHTDVTDLADLPAIPESLSARHERMAALLAERLTADELWNLFVLLDEEPPGGPLGDAISARVIELFPDKF